MNHLQGQGRVASAVDQTAEILPKEANKAKKWLERITNNRSVDRRSYLGQAALGLPDGWRVPDQQSYGTRQIRMPYGYDSLRVRREDSVTTLVLLGGNPDEERTVELNFSTFGSLIGHQELYTQGGQKFVVDAGNGPALLEAAPVATEYQLEQDLKAAATILKRAGVVPAATN